MKHQPLDRARANALAAELTRLSADQWKAKTRAEYYADSDSTFHCASDWYLVNLGRDCALWMDYDRGKYKIHSLLPKHLNQPNVRIYNHPGKKTIGVSSSRTPQSIAKDISRRLLPDFLSYLLKCEANLKQHNAISAHFENIKKQLKQVAPGLRTYGQADESRQKMTLNHGGYPSLDLDLASYSTHDSYTLKVSAQSLEIVTSIIELVNAVNKQ